MKARGKYGATPMSVAVTAFGSTPVLKLLVSKGAEPEARLMASAAAMTTIGIAGILLLGESLSPRLAIAAPLILGGVACAVLPRTRSR